ncbi:hypothetical protein C1646_752190 [Rhizophagus diaphanus]|nr:hypothetical protein C1646_752190 [Rhizophagus diaphanus] [Rhizophagus sp. MUCL 43196]
MVSPEVIIAITMTTRDSRGISAEYLSSWQNELFLSKQELTKANEEYNALNEKYLWSLKIHWKLEDKVEEWKRIIYIIHDLANLQSDKFPVKEYLIVEIRGDWAYLRVLQSKLGAPMTDTDISLYSELKKNLASIALSDVARSRGKYAYILKKIQCWKDVFSKWWCQSRDTYTIPSKYQITTDVWKQPYLNAKIHWIDDIEMNIGKKLLEFLTDNASNMVTSTGCILRAKLFEEFEISDIDHFRYTAHILNLGVKEGIKLVDTKIHKAQETFKIRLY